MFASPWRKESPHVTHKLFCEPKYYSVFTNKKIKHALARRFRCYGFEIIAEYACDPGRAYLIDGSGVVHMIIVDL